VQTAADAFRALAKYESFAPDLVMTDLRMPGMDGIELVSKIRTFENPALVMVMTAFGAVSSAIAALRAGANEYLVKPLDIDALLARLSQLLSHRESRVSPQSRATARNIIGTSTPMQYVFDMVERVAPSRATVLITGESGTGKELVAGAIHRASPRASAPFIKVHCAALAETLLESELFGHERGAFTGALVRKDGRFQLADGGTLFLDEIGEISPSIQIKLLRFLQEYEFERVGGTQTIRVNVRVIAATNLDLLDRIERGLFREDLYYRLNVVSLEMPSLRDRKVDIPLLVQHFVERFARANDKEVVGVEAEAMERLVSHDWPGNVRELENAIERAVVLTTGKLIDTRVLPPSLRPVVEKARPAIPGATLADIERYAILETLKLTGGSKARAAEILGICTRTIHYRLHEYQGAPPSGVDVPYDDGGELLDEK
jgi:DNA-binding NtrC family response regulator